MKEYDLGHVLTGDRYDNFMNIFHQKAGGHSQFEIVEPDYATEEVLKLVHTPEYIHRVEKCRSRDPFDTPLSPGLVRAARLLAGAGKLAGELVYSGRFSKAFVVGGGVQHATRDHEKGFGIFSDVGICAENLMQNHGVEKILILDTDAHAGDGVYRIFIKDPRVLFISLHQHPATLYPGTGFANEVGEAKAKGCSVHVPLAPHSGIRAYEYVLEQIFRPLAEEFQPQIILMVDGADLHFTDRITQMGLTLEGIRTIGSFVCEVSEIVCQGRVVDFIGSGYSYDPDVVSMGWLSSVAGVSGVDLELGEDFRVSGMVDDNEGLEEAQKTTGFIKKKLSNYWSCFSRTSTN